MNATTHNPLMPAGALNAPIAKAKSNFYYAFGIIFILHIVFFGGLLLMQGCQREQPEFAEAEKEAVLPNLDQYYTNFTELPTAPAPRDTFPPVSTPVSTPVTTRPSVGATPVTSTTSSSNLTSRPIDPDPMPPPPETDVAVRPSVPRYTPTTPLPSASQQLQEYTIKSGDMLIKIAAVYGVSVDSILAANPSLDPRRMQLGQVIVIPRKPVTAPTTSTTTSAPAASSGRTYKVASGDNLTKIANRFRTSVDAIKKANNLNSDRINVGQDLIIPQP